MTTRVAVIGLGDMGGAIARRLVDTGHDVLVCDRAADSLAALVDYGARPAPTARDCASADVVLVIVANDEQVVEVVAGEHGVLAGADGHDPLIVVMSTVSVATVRDLAQLARRQGVPLIDSPVSGGAIRARDGALSLLVGGSTQDLALCRPVLQSVGNALFHCGPVGSGALIKIINNIVCAASVFVSAEAYRLALENGVHLD